MASFVTLNGNTTFTINDAQILNIVLNGFSDYSFCFNIVTNLLKHPIEFYRQLFIKICCESNLNSIILSLTMEQKIKLYENWKALTDIEQTVIRYL